MANGGESVGSDSELRTIVGLQRYRQSRQDTALAAQEMDELQPCQARKGWTWS
jgi:hypothetical protein